MHYDQVSEGELERLRLRDSYWFWRWLFGDDHDSGVLDMSKRYKRFETMCNVSQCSLQEAALLIGPAFVYDLTVHPREELTMRTLLREFNADVKDNPLAPYINLCIDDTLAPDEWYLEANGKAVGSEGC